MLDTAARRRIELALIAAHSAYLNTECANVLVRAAREYSRLVKEDPASTGHDRAITELTVIKAEEAARKSESERLAADSEVEATGIRYLVTQEQAAGVLENFRVLSDEWRESFTALMAGDRS